MLLAAHMAGVAMATTGLGACHAIGHALGGRFDVAHGVALSLVLPSVLRLSLPVCVSQLAEVSFSLGAGVTAVTAEENAVAAVTAVTSLAESVGMIHRLADFGITSSDFAVIAADALDDEVLANAPVKPSAADITRMLAAVA
jgi:alcohol dehydrogenase class IV